MSDETQAPEETHEAIKAAMAAAGIEVSEGPTLLTEELQLARDFLHFNGYEPLNEEFHKFVPRDSEEAAASEEAPTEESTVSDTQEQVQDQAPAVEPVAETPVETPPPVEPVDPVVEETPAVDPVVETPVEPVDAPAAAEEGEATSGDEEEGDEEEPKE